MDGPDGAFERASFDRRTFVRYTGAASAVTAGGLAGCLGDGEGDGDEDGDEHEEELPEGVSEEEFESGPVPDVYTTAMSQAEEQRDPDALRTKDEVEFQEADDAVEAGLTESGRNCGNCAEYIPDKNGDGFGACAKVQGYIDPDDWCDIWESIEEAMEEGHDDGSMNESS